MPVEQPPVLPPGNLGGNLAQPDPVQHAADMSDKALAGSNPGMIGISNKKPYGEGLAPKVEEWIL